MSIQRQDRLVQLRSAISEHSPAGSRRGDLIEIERVRQHHIHLILYPSRSLLAPTCILHHLARGTRDERGTVEHDAAVIAELLADAVARHHRHVVRRRMALHRATPMPAADQRVVLRLAADGGGIHQHLRAHQSHDACRFGEPLIPANGNAKFTIFRIPDLEARVAWAEVKLLFISRSIGNVALSVYSQDLSVRVDDGNRVVKGLIVSLEEGDGEYHLQFLGHFSEVRNQLAGASRFGLREGRLLLVLELENGSKTNLAEIPIAEKLLQQNNLRALSSGFTNEFLSLGNVLIHNLPIPHTPALNVRAGHLSGSDSDVSHNSVRSEKL